VLVVHTTAQVAQCASVAQVCQDIDKGVQTFPSQEIVTSTSTVLIASLIFQVALATDSQFTTGVIFDIF